MKFSRIAAGMINTNAIQLQFLLNHASFNETLSTRTNTIDKSPQGNIKNEEGLVLGAMVKILLRRKIKIIWPRWHTFISHTYTRYLLKQVNS